VTSDRPRPGPADPVHELLHELTRIKVPSALNLYDEADSVGWGDSPGQATERCEALRTYLESRWTGIRAGRTDCHRGATHVERVGVRGRGVALERVDALCGWESPPPED